MPATYEPIATTTLSSATSAVSFTSIPSTYTDLAITIYAKGSTSSHLYARWGNGSYDSGTNYSNTGLYTRTTSNDYGVERNTNDTYARLTPFTYGVPSATSTFGTTLVHLQNYSNTNIFKSAISRGASVGSGSYAGAEVAVFQWRSTSAINQIQFSLASGNLDTGTTITIYGIKAA
jgi:hypothetical protein